MHILRYRIPTAVLLATLVFAACEEAGRPASEASETSEAPAAAPATEDAVLFPVRQDGRWGYIDRSGALVVAPRFERARAFAGGLGLVREDGRWGYIDGGGTLVIAPRFEDAWYFSDGVAPVQREGTWLFIDRSGEPVEAVSFTIDPAMLVEERYEPRDLQLARAGGQYGYRGEAGQFVIDPRFEQAWYFDEGLARVRTGGKWGFIDRQGRLAIAPRFDLAWDFADGLALVQVDGKYGYIDTTGTYVWEPTR